MKTIKIIRLDYQQLKYYHDLTITIGTFDGVHLGHAKLIKQVTLFKDTKSAIMTFDFPIANDKQFLFSLDERLKRLAAFKVDYLFVIPFTPEFMNLSAIDFIKLLKKIGVVRIVSGNDFAFGKNLLGTTKMLMDAFELNIASDLLIDGVKVSTTTIKNFLQQGHLKEANAMLGYKFYTKGTVIKGNGIGASLGFRTANLAVNDMMLPKLGVYFCYAILNNKRYKAVVNLGYNPTINLQNKVRVEAHLLNFNKDIYGKELIVEYGCFLRVEEKFKNHQQLVAMITNDVKKVEALTE